jgi:hypothetical protein
MADKYVCLTWTHSHAEEPIAIYYAVEANSSVSRMIKLFKNGQRTLSSLPDSVVKAGDSLVEGDFPSKTEFDRESTKVASNVATGRGESISYRYIDAVEFESEWGKALG